VEKKPEIRGQQKGMCKGRFGSNKNPKTTPKKLQRKKKRLEDGLQPGSKADTLTGESVQRANRNSKTGEWEASLEQWGEEKKKQHDHQAPARV